jgi:hypothetical protein
VIPDLDRKSDAELISAVRGGDSEAYGVLYQRHLHAAKRAASCLARTSVEREDLVADAFTRVLRVLRDGGGPDEEFRAYLLVTMRNGAISGARGAAVSLYADVRGTMPYANAIYPRYLVWHPLDHVSYTVDHPSGPVRPGSRLHIVEALGRDPAQLIDVHVEVEHLDNQAATVTRRVLGTPIVRLENEFTPTPAGTRYLTRMTIGSPRPLGRLVLNRVARHRAFPDPRIRAWIRHHIEEIGNLEHFLPALFADRADHED